MGIRLVLFDLDGTLLPMEQDTFVKRYFGLLAQKLAPHGYAADSLIPAIWAGTKAMVGNTGSVTNETAFWNTFCGIFGQAAKRDEPIFDEFYQNEFQSVQAVCGYTPDAARTVAQLKAKGLRVALATNPLFPAVATESRIRWAGLSPRISSCTPPMKTPAIASPIRPITGPFWIRSVFQPRSASW